MRGNGSLGVDLDRGHFVDGPQLAVELPAQVLGLVRPQFEFRQMDQVGKDLWRDFVGRIHPALYSRSGARFYLPRDWGQGEPAVLCGGPSWRHAPCTHPSAVLK